MTRKKRPGRGVSLLLLQPREIAAAEFKARCLELMDEVDRLGVEVVITKHRKPIAKLVPVRETAGSFCGSMKGMVLKQGDLVSPTGVEWDADESNLT